MSVMSLTRCRHTGHYAAESSKAAGNTASYKTNKAIAKDRSAPIFTRLRAVGDAISDKIRQQTHRRKADVHNEAARY